MRTYSRFVLTNPDMVHRGVLPRHANWSTFLRRLRFVVIDECHTYRGVFGSHVAHVIRRLRRVCARYGSSPIFLLASATVGDPAAHRVAADRARRDGGDRRRFPARRRHVRVVGAAVPARRSRRQPERWSR